jgi:hypothetical protein
VHVIIFKLRHHGWCQCTSWLRVGSAYSQVLPAAWGAWFSAARADSYASGRNLLDAFITRFDKLYYQSRSIRWGYRDYFSITAMMEVRTPHLHSMLRKVCHFWRTFDHDMFVDALRQSVLASDPPTDVNEMFECYDKELRLLFDCHVPSKSVVIRSRSKSPWFDGECRYLKKLTRKQEKVNRQVRRQGSLVE